MSDEVKGRGRLRMNGAERRCNHLWQPYSDSVRMWQVCVKCEERKDMPTHSEMLAETLRYIFRDL